MSNKKTEPVTLDVKPSGGGFRASWVYGGNAFYTTATYPTAAAAATVARRYLAKYNTMSPDAFVYKEAVWPHPFLKEVP